jgi:hypothetical protein
MVVGVTLDKIVELHPVLYHMAEFGTWESIRTHGLLSTSALLDLFGYTGEKRANIEQCRRRTSIPITNDQHGNAVIRDQRPMSDSKLAKCLRDGLTPTDWYRILNGKVFFWLTEARLLTLMKAYADSEHLVLEVDTRELLRTCGDNVMLAPMNTGTTNPMAHPRGLATFQPPHRYRFEMNRKRKGGPRKAIVELTVNHSVCKISDFTVRATHRRYENGRAPITEIVFAR